MFKNIQFFKHFQKFKNNDAELQKQYYTVYTHFIEHEMDLKQ